MFSKFGTSTLRLYLEQDNISLLKIIIIKVNKKFGPEEDRGFVCDVKAWGSTRLGY